MVLHCCLCFEHRKWAQMSLKREVSTISELPPARVSCATTGELICLSKGYRRVGEFPSREETIIFNYQFVCLSVAPYITRWGNRSHCACKEQVGGFWCSAASKHSSKNVSDQPVPQSTSRKHPHPSMGHLSSCPDVWYTWRNPHLNAHMDWNNIDLMEKTIDFWAPWTIKPFRNVLLSTKWPLKSIQRLHHTYFGGGTSAERYLVIYWYFLFSDISIFFTQFFIAISLLSFPNSNIFPNNLFYCWLGGFCWFVCSSFPLIGIYLQSNFSLLSWPEIP